MKFSQKMKQYLSVFSIVLLLFSSFPSQSFAHNLEMEDLIEPSELIDETAGETNDYEADNYSSEEDGKVKVKIENTREAKDGIKAKTKIEKEEKNEIKQQERSTATEDKTVKIKEQTSVSENLSDQETKELEAGEVLFTIPENAELFIGTKSKHFIKFDEVEPAEEAIHNGDGTKTYFYQLEANKEYNYRVSEEGKLTNTGTFRANKNNTELEITKADLEAFNPKAILNRGTYIEGNIFLNINEQNHLQLAENETFKLLPMRNWQALIEGINNYFFEPDFHYEIITGDDVISIHPDGPGSYAEIKAEREGTAIVKVTYDALKVHGSAYEGGNFSAIWPENVGLFVVTVGDEVDIDTGIESNKERNIKAGISGNLQQGVFDAEIDSVYYLEDEPGAYYTFTPEEGAEVSVLRPTINHEQGTASYGDGKFTKDEVVKNDDDSFTILLTEGRNIVKVEKDGQAAYHVMTARPLNVEIENLSNPGQEVAPGDEVKVTFKGLSFPANKLAGIYNFNAQLIFSSHDGKELFKGDRRQYNITTQANSITFTVPEGHEGAYYLKDGHISLGFFGSPIGSHHYIDAEVGAVPNLNAQQVEGYYSIFPEIEILPDENASDDPEVDLEPLKDLIAKAKEMAKQTELYTEKTLANLKDVIKEVESTLDTIDDEVALQKKMDALNGAIEQLRQKADKSSLEEKVQEAKAIDLSNKTEDSKENFKSVLNEAITVLENNEASQEQIDQVLEKLNKAIKNLQDRAPPVDEVEVSVRIEGHKETLVEPTKLKVSSFDLAPYVTSGEIENFDNPRAIHAIIDALQTIEGFDATDEEQFKLGFGGNYIEQIGDVGQFTAGQNSGWMYAVNHNIPDIGVADYELKDGDTIVLYFVEDFMDNIYTWFNKEGYTVSTSEEATFVLNGFSEYQDDSVEGSSLLIDNKPYEIDGEKVLFDKDGKVTVIFDEPGTYLLSAIRYNENGVVNISRPYAVVNVVDEDVEPEVDETPPVISIRGIKDGQKFLQNSIEFSVEVVDDVDGKVDPVVKVNDQTVSMKDGKYQATLKEGKNIILVEAKDKAGNEATEEITLFYEKPQLNVSTDKALKDLIDYIFKTGVKSDWLAIGLHQAGEKVPASYQDTFAKHVKEQIIKAKESERLLITDVERLTLTALALNIDPTDVNGVNLIELIYNSPDRTLWDGTVVDILTYQGNNGIAFALIALDSANFPVPDDAKWTREKLVDELLANQNNDGSWSLNKEYDAPNIDITAMVLTALAPYTEEDKVQKAVEKGIDFLAKSQGEDGGFDGGSAVGGVTSEATAQVIIALTANGIDPKSEQFTTSMNLIDHLLSYQLPNGGFTHTLGESKANDIATEQALLALAAYKLFTEENLSLYDFGQLDELDLESITDLDKELEGDNRPEKDPQPGESSDKNTDKKNDELYDEQDELSVEVAEQDGSEEKNKLPSTSTQMFTYLLLGALLIALGLMLYFLRKRNITTR